MKKQSKYGLIALFFALAALVVWDQALAGGSTHHNDELEAEAKAEATATAEAAAEAAAGAEAAANASNEGNQLEVDASDQSRVDHRTNVYALSLEFPNLAGCIGGGQGGIGTERGNSGFLGLNLTNVACWMQQLAESEEDLDIRARLKCGDKHYRRAINLYDRKGSVTQEMQRCIDYVIPKWTAAIEYERSTIDDLKRRLEAADNLADLQQRHAEVCEESKERCEQQLFQGTK